ncbi:NAD(P)-binding protein [Abortiporus biennis]|nr:NAD(P)-binding protein [Abortiporus biennis]
MPSYVSKSPKNIVFALARNPDTSQELQDLHKSRKNVHLLQADITDVKALKAAATKVASVTDGKLDYLVNNAAFADFISTLNHTDTFLSPPFKVNVIGTIHTTNTFLPLLRKTAETSTAKIICLSTALSDPEFTVRLQFTNLSPYSASKAALNMVVAKYAAEYKDNSNIVFLAISPGLVDTAVKPPTPEELENYMKMIVACKKFYPDWIGVPLTPEQSVGYMLDVFEKVTAADSGAFLSHWGNKQWL